MEKRGLEKQINEIVEKFLEKSKDKEILVVSHFDTDGITSATILLQTLKRLDKIFTVRILKRIEENFINTLPRDKLIIFLDLASGSLHEISSSGLNDVFIIDHHEVIHAIPENVHIINPEINGREKISSAGLTYLFSKKIDEKNKEFSKLAVLGMIGDLMESNLDKLNIEIINDGEIQRKRGLLIYPSTRPLNRVLEYCSDPYIPGVTGCPEGVIELLRESGIECNGTYKSLIELNEKEMSKLITSIMLRNPKAKNKEIIGDIFLLKFFSKVEDARELSAIINACSRLGKPELAIQLCMEISEAKKKAEQMHIKYKQRIISGLKTVDESEQRKGNGFVIINAKEKIEDALIGTIASILSASSIYEDGTIIVTMSYYDDKIKVSMRSSGKSTRNLREILNEVIEKIGGNVGGHEVAAGCMVSRDKENEFLELLQKTLEIKMVKV